MPSVPPEAGKRHWILWDRTYRQLCTITGAAATLAPGQLISSSILDLFLQPTELIEMHRGKHKETHSKDDPGWPPHSLEPGGSGDISCRAQTLGLGPPYAEGTINTHLQKGQIQVTV